MKTYYINVDTRTNDDKNNLFSDYAICLEEKIHNVKNISITCIEVPITYFNISFCMNNNYFKVTNLTINQSIILFLPDNNYNITSISETLNYLLSENEITKDLQTKQSMLQTISFSSEIHKYKIEFAINNVGIIDTCFFRCKLGWALGFRFFTYIIEPGTEIIAETICDFTNPRYLYLSLEHIDCHNHSDFVSSFFIHKKNKHIIARITLDQQNFPYGSILNANLSNGMLISATRTFHKKTDIKRIKCKLLNEYGYIMNLNGFDISFVINAECEES